MADHSSFARIKKSPARFGNGVMLLDHSATMACNVQQERSRKMALTMVVYFIPVRKVRKTHVAILSGEIKKKTKTHSSHFPLCILATNWLSLTNWLSKIATAVSLIIHHKDSILVL